MGKMVLTSERVSLAVGYVMLFTITPFVAVVIGSAVLWDALDRGFRGRPLDGLLMAAAGWVNKVTAEHNAKFVKVKEDAFVMNALWLLGGFVPLLCAGCFYYTLQHGFSLYVCYMYHVLRIGPYFMNFAYVYTMCHKEGHSYTGLYKDPYNSTLRNAFNWWIGLFYGVLPSSFAYGHSVNHHKYNNGPQDVISTADKPRDDYVNFLSFLPRFLLYATNVSTTWQFWSEGNRMVAVKMVVGSLWWLGFVVGVGYFHTMFALTFLVYPLLENVMLLACINWCWHGFIDPKDPEDGYVGSVTIYNGPINVLNEDYHVVHHQYPGVHWTKHEDRYHKHFDRGEYADHKATCFTDTHVFELFFVIILADYDYLVEHFVDHSKTLSKDEIRELLHARLNACWWGPRAPKDLKLKGSEIGNFDMWAGTGNDDKAQ
eukprot:m.65608 g.65608  ORF g.65608 m.65608 type:complete len:428 (+) comp13677_c0_seq2:140-1423(+)